MHELSISSYFVLNQVCLALELLDQDDLAYCAMCDAVHVNDASCQRMG